MSGFTQLYPLIAMDNSVDVFHNGFDTSLFAYGYKCLESTHEYPRDEQFNAQSKIFTALPNNLILMRNI